VAQNKVVLNKNLYICHTTGWHPLRMNWRYVLQAVWLTNGFIVTNRGFEIILHLQWLNNTNIGQFVDRKLKFQNHSHLHLHVQCNRHTDKTKEWVTEESDSWQGWELHHLQRVQTGSRAHPAGRGSIRGVKRSERYVEHSPQLVSWLRMHEAQQPLLHVASWCERRQFYPLILPSPAVYYPQITVPFMHSQPQ